MQFSKTFQPSMTLKWGALKNRKHAQIVHIDVYIDGITIGAEFFMDALLHCIASTERVRKGIQ